MRRQLLVVVAIAAAAPPAHAAESVEVRFQVRGDFAACVTVAADEPGPVAGVFGAAGVVTGPGTIVEPVAGGAPFAFDGPGAWYGCLPGAYAGATGGSVTYAVAYTSRSGDGVELLRCSPAGSGVSCS